MEVLFAHAPVFGAVLLVNVLGWLTPGPNMLVVAAASLSRGTRAGIVTGCGVAAGGLVWASLAVLGVGVVFETLPTLFAALKIAGGLYLVWLGVRTWRAASPLAVPTHGGPRAGGFVRGMAVNLTNPKAILFHGAVLAAVVPQGAPLWLLVVIVLFSQTQATLQHGLTAVMFGTRMAASVFGALGVWSDRLFGAIFVTFGAGVIWHSLRRS
ncbi:MAG: LysE family transporter [Jannaschia sp.]